MITNHRDTALTLKHLFRVKEETMPIKRDNNQAKAVEETTKSRTLRADSTGSTDNSMCSKMVCDCCGSTSFDHEANGCDHEERSLHFFEHPST